MKVILIAPAWRDTLWEEVKAIFPPLNLATIAALTPEEIEVKIVDESLEEIDFDEQADLVGITALTAIAPRAYQIADRYRRQGVKVVLGGMHPSAVPDEAIEHADAVVVGEAETSWPRLLEDFRLGRLQPFYRNEQRPSLNNMVVPRREMFAEKDYYCRNTMQTTRGCPNACTFCAVTGFFGHTYRFRPVQDIVDELQSLAGQLVVFVDDNIVGNPEFAKKLFQALIPLKLKWFSQGSLSLAADAELLELARKSGCIGMFIGFESLSQNNLAQVGKVGNDVKTYRDSIKRIHDQGIAIEGAFIFGFDQDDPSVFEETVRFAQDTKLELAQFGILTPFPGTPLYHKLQKEGRITERDWSKYNIANVVFQPRQMTRQELQDGFNWAWREFYSYRSILSRLGVNRDNLAFLYALNYAFRQRVGKYIEAPALTAPELVESPV